MSGRLAPFVALCIVGGCTLSSPYPRSRDEVGDLCIDGIDNDLDGTHDASELGADGSSQPCAAWHASLDDVTAPARPRGECPAGWTSPPCTAPTTRPGATARADLAVETTAIHVDASAPIGVAGDGTPGSPVRTITAGLELVTTGRVRVAIHAGRYVEAVAIPPGVTLYGEGAELVTIEGAITTDDCQSATTTTLALEGVTVLGTITVDDACELTLARMRTTETITIANATLGTADAELSGAPALSASDNAIVRWTDTTVVGAADGSGRALAAELVDSHLEMSRSSVTLEPTATGTLMTVEGAFAELVADASALTASGTGQEGVRLDDGAQATLRSTWIRVDDGFGLRAMNASLELVDVEMDGSGAPGTDAPAIVALASTLSTSRVAITGTRGRGILVGVATVGTIVVGTTAILEDLSIREVVANDAGDAIGIDVEKGTIVTARRVRIRGAGTVGIRAGVDSAARDDASVTLSDVAILATGFVSACGADCVDGIGLHVTPFGTTDANRFYVTATAGCGIRIDASALVSVVRSRARSGALTDNRYGLCVTPPYDPGAVALNMPGVLFRDNRADGYVVGDHATCIDGSARCGTLFGTETAP